MDNTPYKGATELKYKRDKKKAKKEVRRMGIVCTCGALEKYYTTLYYIHDKECVINKNRTE